jgi:hypothetical protein
MSKAERTNMDYVSRIIESLTSTSVTIQCWGATFAGGANDPSGQIVQSLMDYLERNDFEKIEIGDELHQLTIGRAAVSLAHLILSSDQKLRDIKVSRANVLFEHLCRSDSIEIAHHAKYALELLAGA